MCVLKMQTSIINKGEEQGEKDISLEWITKEGPT